MKRKTVMAKDLTLFRSKPMFHSFLCSVCGEMDQSGRRRLTNEGMTAFICYKCLRKALFAARERASRLSAMRKAEDTIRERQNTANETLGVKKDA